MERIGDDGTVYFTQTAREAVTAIDPGLAEPLEIGDLPARAERLDAALR